MTSAKQENKERTARKQRRQRKARGRATLIVNARSGPSGPIDARDDSIRSVSERVGERVREIVEMLATHGIEVEVRMTRRRKQATREAHAAAKARVQLVIAAGGDGTVSAVARGLVGTTAALGIVPLGTHDNTIATFLGVPDSLGAACALLGRGVVHAMDVGQITATGATGSKKPRLFFERGAVGMTAALMPVGQDIEERWWGGPPKSQPVAQHMTPAHATVRLDKVSPARHATTLLVEVANGPHPSHHGARPATVLAAQSEPPTDGAAATTALDVSIYHDLDQVDLAVRFAALNAGRPPRDARIERARARRVDVRTATAMPVTADSKVIGVTPARFDLLPAALLVASGPGWPQGCDQGSASTDR